MLHLDSLRDLFGPGLVFLLLAFWLTRKAWRASRTERALELEREDDAKAAALLPRAQPPEQPQRPRLIALPVAAPLEADPLARADRSQATPEHLAAVSLLLREQQGRAPFEVLWVRSLGAHAAWLESLPGGAHELKIARLEGARVAERWTFR